MKGVKKKITPGQIDKIIELSLRKSDKIALQQLIEEPLSYMENKLFSRPAIMRTIMNEPVAVVTGTTPTSEQEQALFTQFNYARFKMAQCRRKLLRSAHWDISLVRELLDWNQKQLYTRSQIVTANMGLVLAMAKRFRASDVEFTDLISEGSMALLRASEKFDCSFGWKFSTYACRAILKAFSRAAKQNYRYRSRFPVQLEPTMIKDDFIDQNRLAHQQDWVDEVCYVVNKNLAGLSGIEQSVVEMRFPLNNKDLKPPTLKQVGEVLGLTKERIRQIQNKALGKLRLVVEDRMVVT